MRIWAVTAALLALACTGCLGAGSSGASPSSRATPTLVPQTAFAGSARACPVARSYTPVLSDSTGPPGSLIAVSGRLPLRGEDGRRRPGSDPTRVSVWWHLPADRWTSVLATNAHAAGARLLASVAVPRPTPCSYQVAVRVPRVADGSYPLLVIMAGGGGWARLAPVRFRVATD
jgi:hypothetical protein